MQCQEKVSSEGSWPCHSSCIIPVSPAGDIRLQVWTAGQKPEMNISRAQASDDFRQASHALREVSAAGSALQSLTLLLGLS